MEVSLFDQGSDGLEVEFPFEVGSEALPSRIGPLHFEQFQLGSEAVARERVEDAGRVPLSGGAGDVVEPVDSGNGLRPNAFNHERTVVFADSFELRAETDEHLRILEADNYLAVRAKHKDILLHYF